MSCDGKGHCGHSPCPHEIKTQGRIDEIILKQGWDGESINDLVWEFIGEKGLFSELTDFLQGKADEENNECQEEPDTVCPTCGSSESTPLSTLATKKYVRCRKCGIDYYI